jgi:hypothetical protein
MNRLNISVPKKRDNKVREPVVPETVLAGIKKKGPTIKDL